MQLTQFILILFNFSANLPSYKSDGLSKSNGPLSFGRHQSGLLLKKQSAENPAKKPGSRHSVKKLEN
jgi:hypothetical protein